MTPRLPSPTAPISLFISFLLIHEAEVEHLSNTVGAGDENYRTDLKPLNCIYFFFFFFYRCISLTWPPRFRASSPPRSCTWSLSAAWWCGSGRSGSRPPWRRRAPRWAGCGARWRCWWWPGRRPCSPGCRFLSPGWGGRGVGWCWSGAPEEEQGEDAEDAAVLRRDRRQAVMRSTSAFCLSK